VVVGDYFHREALFQVDAISRARSIKGGRANSFLSSVGESPGRSSIRSRAIHYACRRTATAHADDRRAAAGAESLRSRAIQPLVPETERYGVSFRGKVPARTAVDLFTEFSYRNIFTEQTARAGADRGDVEGHRRFRGRIRSTHRHGRLFRYRVTEAGPRIDEIDTDVYRALAGLKFRFRAAGKWRPRCCTAKTRARTRAFNNLSRAAVVARGLNDPNPETSFNVFGAGDNVNNPETIQSFLATTVREGESLLFAADAKANGPLFKLPAGDLLTAFGVEYRFEELSDRFDPFSASGGVIDLNSTSASGNRDIIAGFAEFYIPIVSNEMKIPGIHKLEAQFAVRAENYSDFGSTVNPKIGLAWQPIPDWFLVRGSYSTGFRAPSLVQSSTGSLTFSQELQDTARFAVTGSPEDESSSVQILSGGNPELDSEDSQNFSAGIVITPPMLRGLTLSADFFHIEIEKSVAEPRLAVHRRQRSRLPGARRSRTADCERRCARYSWLAASSLTPRSRTSDLSRWRESMARSST
jgi:outer membrane receptor protein involved in Fe transport